jgi:stress-induced morphogen
MIAIESVRAMILAAFPGAEVTITDLTGTSDHFEAVVVAKEFEGKSRIEQHKMVYGSLGAHMGNAIHALALKTSAPAARAK